MSLLKRRSIPALVLVFLAGFLGVEQNLLAQETAKQILVVEVRKKLQLTSKDPVVRDYYVNSGSGSGLKAGAFVTVYRRVPLADPNREKTQTHVEIPVGVMRVIYADTNTSIGRIHTIRSVADSPILDSDVFMVGDRLDMSTLGFERRSVETQEESKPTQQVKSSTAQPEEARSTASEPKATDKADMKALPAQAKSVEILTK